MDRGLAGASSTRSRGEGQQFGLGGRGAGQQRGKGHRQFARVGVGRAHGGAQVHGRVRAQRVLDHLGVDVVAAADDQVLGAAGQVQPPERVAKAQVAGDQPAVGGERLGRLGRVEVAREQVGRLVEHHARLARRAVPAPSGRRRRPAPRPESRVGQGASPRSRPVPRRRAG